MPKATVRVLRFLTPVTALVSVVAQAIALCSNRWLHSEELIVNTKYNGTGDSEYFSKFTVSGLWELCYNDQNKNVDKNDPVDSISILYTAGSKDVHCFYIDYFPKEEYSPDPTDSTMAIPYAVKRASAFIFISCFVLVLGEALCFLGLIFRRRRVLIFAAGIAFILSGLMILVGMVIYISTFKSEVGHKLRPKSSFQGPLFIYRYGFSFLLAVTGLMTCELTGTFAIFLYIHRYQEDWKKRADHRHHHKFSEFVTTAEDHVPCRRHHPVGVVGQAHTLGRTGAEYASRDASPCGGVPSSSRAGGPRRSNIPATAPVLTHSESMRDLSYYNFPPFSRDTTCNTVSTTADINREYSRDFSFETLRRTTPV